jgi:hypothetical protein
MIAMSSTYGDFFVPCKLMICIESGKYGNESPDSNHSLVEPSEQNNAHRESKFTEC